MLQVKSKKKSQYAVCEKKEKKSQYSMNSVVRNNEQQEVYDCSKSVTTTAAKNEAKKKILWLMILLTFMFPGEECVVTPDSLYGSACYSEDIESDLISLAATGRSEKDRRKTNTWLFIFPFILTQDVVTEGKKS